MILIAGVSPKTKTLESTPRLCPSCGLAQAYLKRVDHYLSLFFIPVFRVKTGEPILVCNRCESAGFMHPEGHSDTEHQTTHSVMCRQCLRTLDPNFSYCPFCGARQ